MASVQLYGKNMAYARIVEYYRDPMTNKQKYKVVRNLGSVASFNAADPKALDKVREGLKGGGGAAQREARAASLARALADPGLEGAALINYGCLVYAKVFRDLKLDAFLKQAQSKYSRAGFDMARAVELLVQSRLMAPSSKLKAFESQGSYSNFAEGEVKLASAYRALDFLAKNKERAESHLSKQLRGRPAKDLAVAFYDVTTYYYESVSKDALKAFGYSKDNKVNQVQVVMGLLIDPDGIPVSYDLFPGSTSDFSTLEPVMRRLKERTGVSKVIITADRGLNSGKNLLMLRQLGFGYIMAYKIKSASKAMKEAVLGDGYAHSGGGLMWKEAPITVKAKGGEGPGFVDRLIITHSAKRAEKDRADRERLLKKARSLTERPSQLKAEMKKGGKKYVALTAKDGRQMSFLEGLEAGVDMKKADEDGAFDGYYAIQCSEPGFTPGMIMGAYGGLWKIEESFRVLKSCLAARPAYVWTENRIRGHFMSCFMALVVQRVLEKRLKEAGINISSEKVQSALGSAMVSEIAPPGQGRVYMKSKSAPEFQQVLGALGLSDIDTVSAARPKLS